jgi:hypothetical protein
MKKQIFQFIILATLLTFAACGDDEVDVTTPTMEAVGFKNCK